MPRGAINLCLSAPASDQHAQVLQLLNAVAQKHPVLAGLLQNFLSQAQQQHAANEDEDEDEDDDEIMRQGTSL